MSENSKVPFSQRPGRHERHFRRKVNNPLFPRPIHQYRDEDLLEVQRLDHEELVSFITELRTLVGEIARIPTSLDGEKLLQYKESLEKAYETAAGLAEDQTENQAAIDHLTQIISNSITRNTGGDQLAMTELEQEADARKLHYQLLKHPLVADLLHPQSLIATDELLPSLASAQADEVEAALSLFDSEQQGELRLQCEELLSNHLNHAGVVQLWQCFNREAKGAP